MQMQEHDLVRMNAALRHRLRNFASGIKSAATVLSKELEDKASPDILEYFPLIIRECDRIGEVTNRMSLLFDSLPDEPAEPLEAWLRRVQQHIRAAFPTAPLAVEAPAAAMECSIPRSSLTAAAAAEIVHNAIEASPQAGATLSVRRNRDTIVIRIEDHGPGVAADMRPNLFQPFTTTRSQHLGIGLALARRIARHAGGDVQATHTPGAGLAVEMTLPDGTMPKERTP
jgi:two-component system C4-dicarboxylate transport sensor histidine kinase DctB